VTDVDPKGEWIKCEHKGATRTVKLDPNVQIIIKGEVKGDMGRKDIPAQVQVGDTVTLKGVKKDKDGGDDTCMKSFALESKKGEDAKENAEEAEEGDNQ
jgi:hypothetical protein